MFRRRKDRERITERGNTRCWGRSPSPGAVKEAYEELALDAKKKEKAAREEERKLEKESMKKRKRTLSISSDSEDEKVKKKKSKKSKKEKKKKHKKEKKVKKEIKEEASSSEEEKEEDEWIELTDDMKKEAESQEEEMIGPQIPEEFFAKTSEVNYFELNASERKNMNRGEAAALAAYAAQGKRIPRRGEIGLSSQQIDTFEEAGYVMSGSRHKGMEATRMRKENLIMSAEEKRLLSGHSREKRKEKEDAIMKQFRSLIDSKRQP